MDEAAMDLASHENDDHASTWYPFFFKKSIYMTIDYGWLDTKDIKRCSDLKDCWSFSIGMKPYCLSPGTRRGSL